MKAILYLLLNVGALAAPTALGAPQTKRQLKSWPDLCGDDKLRGQQAWKEAGNIARGMVGFATSGIKEGPTIDYVEYNKGRSDKEKVSIPSWYSTWIEANYDWSCTEECQIGDGYIDECKETRLNADVLLVLESYRNLNNFIRSFQRAITAQVNYISNEIPHMMEEFGMDVGEDVKWDKIIGFMTAAAGTMGALIPAAGAPAAGIGLASSFALMIIPDPEEEKKLGALGELAHSLGSYFNVTQKNIDNYLNTQVKQFYNGNANDLFLELKKETSFPELIRGGDWSGKPDGYIIDESDNNIKAAMASVVINTIWQTAKMYVIKLDGPAWSKDHGDLCKDGVFFQGIQPGGKVCDDDGSVYMIAHWIEEGNIKDKETFQDVKGLDKLVDYAIDWKEIIRATTANFKEGGFGYLPDRKVIGERVKNTKPEDPQNFGLIRSWSLPYCEIKPQFEGKSKDLEQSIVDMAKRCVDFKDKNKKDFPYDGPQKKGENQPSCMGPGCRL